MKKISTLIIASFVGLAAHTQIIDTLTSGHNNSLTGGLVGYTAIPVLDNAHGTGGVGVWFPSSASGLSASYTGTSNTAEQVLFSSSSGPYMTYRQPRGTTGKPNALACAQGVVENWYGRVSDQAASQ